MSLYLAILIGKLISFLTKLFNIGGGSAAPGYYALKIEPRLVEKLASKIPQTIIITGTNGKTTTARLLAHFVKTQGLKVLRNHTGSNLERGVASSLIANYPNLSKFDLAIWELDEAAFNSTALKLNPQIIIFLNAFRDQLDRYGEVDTIIKKWQETVKKISSETLILINGDDHSLAKLTKEFKGKVETFGLNEYAIEGESLEREKIKKELDIEAKNIKLNNLESTLFELTINDKQYTINLPLPGVYQIYNFLAAYTAIYHLNLDLNKALDSLKDYKSAFGRFEKVKLGKTEGYILLIKNPAGATQVFETIAPQLKKEDRLLIALNDNFADGTDVSWIWDAKFEKLQNSSRAKSRDNNIIVSGTRAQDLAVRLKYVGFDPDMITLENSLERALERSKQGLNGRLFILPTYTALLELQQILTKTGVKSYYWKED